MFEQWSPCHEADVAIEYLTNKDHACRKPDQPFALIVSMNPPHQPYEMVPDEYVQRYHDASPRELLNRPNVNFDSTAPRAVEARRQVRNHFAMITGVDEQFGRILDALRSLGLEQDTLVIFASDHGDMMGSHDRLEKSVWHDESIRIPFIARFPGRIPPDTSDDILLSVPDIMPTILGLLGLESLCPEKVEGTNYAGVLTGHRSTRPDSAYYINIERNARGVRTHRYTYACAHAGDLPGEFLFDNLEDPYQLRNQAMEHPHIVKQMRNQTSYWLNQTHDSWSFEIF